MKQSIFLTILCLFTGLQAFAQDTIVAMTTIEDSVDIYVEWTGAGSLTANGVKLRGSKAANTIFPTIDGSIVVTVTGDAQLTHLYCDNNPLTKCAGLTSLSCNNNSLSDLDIANCPDLKYLSANNQTVVLPVIKVDVTHYTEQLLNHGQNKFIVIAF